MTAGFDRGHEVDHAIMASSRKERETCALPQMLDVGEVAQLFSRSRRTIRWWIASGRLRAVRIGRSPFVPASEIDALLSGDPFAQRADDES